jgi:hypothetical protein
MREMKFAGAGPAFTSFHQATGQEAPSRGKEKLAMKRLTGLVPITLFVLLGCSAAFGEGLVTLGLVDNNDNFLCDYLNFSYGTSLASGIDVQEACGIDDGTLIGVVTTLPAGFMFPVSGPIVMLADNAEDAVAGGYAGTQFILVTKTTASKTHYGWESLFNIYDSFYVVLYDYGYLTNDLPPSPLVGKEGEKAPRSATGLISRPAKVGK